MILVRVPPSSCPTSGWAQRFLAKRKAAAGRGIAAAMGKLVAAPARTDRTRDIRSTASA